MYNLLYINFLSIKMLKDKKINLSTSFSRGREIYHLFKSVLEFHKGNSELGDQLIMRIHTGVSSWAARMDSQQGKRFKFLHASSLKLLNF